MTTLSEAAFRRKPVLIAGAGPVGLTLAMALARQGVAVRIVEKAAERTDKSKALVLWPRTLEMLDVQRCVQPFLDAGVPAVGARILADGKVLVHASLATARTPYRYALMIPQSDTERLLEAQLARLGVTVERRVEFVSFVDDGEGISAVLRHDDGRTDTAEAAWLAGCDGAHSTVRHQLGVPFAGHTLPSGWLLADVQLDGDVPRDEITICWTPDGVLAVFPIRGNRFRVIGDIVLDTVTLPDVQALLDSRGPPGLRAHVAVWLAHFTINERKVKDYRHGHVFLAGDAAHIHSPAGGQGMNTGMQDAINLAWKLAMVWHGRMAPTLLDSYSVERSAIGDQVLRNAGNMTAVAMIRNPVLQGLRDLAAGTLGQVPALRQRLVDQLTELDLHYPDSPLTSAPRGASRHPAGGDRAPDVALACDAPGVARLHDILATGRFALFSVGADAVAVPEALKNIALAAHASSADGYEADHVYLVRPDGYVAMSTRPEDAGSLVEALDRWARGNRRS
ncbi:FAD-dependent monooxygenase [Variovorax sp. PAMC 28711]|uniref:FAD-dependent monooxygenase n=1 Tax=Variovorax sp. PAMC 28711 TaxID=1795631 RepID=UPI00078EE449|nr:FAD-dependent monooxygenase [Variovorax sp. PAMC 28711]AMM26358.1 hypothetical protein AX767_19885 [Variovorax sp. PAMC 28711]